MSARDSGLNFQPDLVSLKDRGLFRRLVEINSPQGPIIKIGNREVLNFCSNDYLGLANDERLKTAMADAVARYGIGSGASPLICGRSEAHRLLEQQVADVTGRDRALTFSSGYLANLAVVSAFSPGRNGRIYEDRQNHASLIDGAILGRSRLTRFKHCDVAALSEAMHRNHSRSLVLTDSVFSMDGDIAPIPGLVELCKKTAAMLIVDDAHGFGVLGEKGKGSLAQFRLTQSEVPLLVITFGKAVGVAGACVSGPSDLIEMLVQKGRPYIYSTAMPPALAVTICESLKIILEEEHRREYLFRLISIFRAGCRELSLPVLTSTTPIQPLIIGANNIAVKISQKLFDRGVFIAAIRPPTVPVNSARLRITLTAAHTEDHVNKLLDILSKTLKEYC